MRIAIVGAGVAGCIVARTLSRLGGADTKYVNSIDVAANRRRAPHRHRLR